MDPNFGLFFGVQQCGGDPWQMERVFQRYFEPIIIPAERQEVHLREKNSIAAAEVLLTVKTLQAGKATRCDEI